MVVPIVRLTLVLPNIINGSPLLSLSVIRPTQLLLPVSLLTRPLIEAELANEIKSGTLRAMTVLFTLSLVLMMMPSSFPGRFVLLNIPVNNKLFATGALSVGPSMIVPLSVNVGVTECRARRSGKPYGSTMVMILTGLWQMKPLPLGAPDV